MSHENEAIATQRPHGTFTLSWLVVSLVGLGLAALVVMIGFVVVFAIIWPEVYDFLSDTHQGPRRPYWMIQLIWVILFSMPVVCGLLVGVGQGILLGRYGSGIGRGWILSTTLAIALLGYVVLVLSPATSGRIIAALTARIPLAQRFPNLTEALLGWILLTIAGTWLHLLQWSVMVGRFLRAWLWLLVGFVSASIYFIVRCGVHLFVHVLGIGAAISPHYSGILAAALAYGLLGGLTWQELLAHQRRL